MENNFQFLIYRSAEEDVSINAVVKDESIWLTQQGMAELFGVQKPAISKHLKNIFEEGELDEKWLFPKWKQPHITVLWTIRRRPEKQTSTTSMPLSLWDTVSTPAGLRSSVSGYRHSQRVYDQGLCAG